jgi:hypothetical protein
MAMTAAQRTEIIQTVVGMFGAAPGATYLNELSAYAGNVKGLIKDLTGTNAFKSIYPTFLTNEEFATNFLNNLLGTTVTDTAAKTWAKNWMKGLLDAGKSRGDVIFEALDALKAIPTTDTTWGNAAKQFANKVTVAEHYSVTMAAAVTNLATLQSVIANVTDSTDVSNPAQVIAGTPGGTTGQTFTLTSGTDTLTGTSGNDTVTGIFGAGSATFNAGDSIDGKGGNDTLNLIANGTAASDPVTVKDVDLINVQAANTGGAILDALLFTDVGAIHSKDSVGNLTINNLKLGTAVGVNNGTKDLTAVFTGTSGTSDEAMVQLNKAGSKSGNTITRSTIDVSTSNTIEAVKVDVLGGDNYVTIKGGTANKTLTIVGNGTGVADINTTDVVTKVDASAYKGKLDLTLGGTSNVAVTGTAQDDVFRFGATLNSADTITGGDGKDVLRATLSASQTPTVSGVEQGILTFSGTSGIYNASKTSGMTVVNLAAAAAGDGATISNAKAELATINILRDTATAFQLGGGVTVNYASGAKANTTVNIGGAADYTLGALTIGNASTITIQSKDKNATIGAQTFADATELTYIAKDGTLTATAAAVTADKVETLTFTADGKALTVNNVANSFDKLSVLDVTATGANAVVYAGVSPTPAAAATISEVNVKGTNATSDLNVTVNGVTGGANFTISTVNFEVNGTSGTQKLTIVTDSNTPTIAALNVKAAENATATVVLDESGATAFTIQGGVFEGKGNITIEGGPNIDKIDLSNIDRSTLASNSTLTIKLNQNGTVVGTNGKDTIDASAANVTIKFADSAAANGQDTITGFDGSADKLKVGSFVTGTIATDTADATVGLDMTGANEKVGLLYNFTGNLAASNIIATGAVGANQIKMNDNQKAVILTTTDTDGNDLGAGGTNANSFKVYYVYDADSSTGTNFIVELVGTVTCSADTDLATNLGTIVIA